MQPFDLDILLTFGLAIFFAVGWAAFRVTGSVVFVLMAVRARHRVKLDLHGQSCNSWE